MLLSWDFLDRVDYNLELYISKITLLSLELLFSVNFITRENEDSKLGHVHRSPENRAKLQILLTSSMILHFKQALSSY